MMEKRNSIKRTYLILLGVFAIIFIATVFSYAYFAVRTNISNSATANIIIANGSSGNFSVTGGNVNLDILTDNMLINSADNETAIVNKNVSVNVNLESNGKMICFYDVSWMWTSGGYEKTINAEKELTLSGSNGVKSINEIQLPNYGTNMHLGTFYINSINGLATQTWTFNLRFYNLANLIQNAHAGKRYSGKIVIDNADCRSTENPVFVSELSSGKYVTYNGATSTVSSIDSNTGNATTSSSVIIPGNYYIASGKGINGDPYKIVYNDNLVINGEIEKLSNYNFNSLEFGGNNSDYYLYRSGSTSITVPSKFYFPIDSSLEYSQRIDLKASDTNGKNYVGFYTFDENFLKILPENVMWYGGTGLAAGTIQLARQLNPGDTVIYLTDITSGTHFKSTTTAYQLGLIFWTQKANDGTLYAPGTYSREVYTNLYTFSNINFTSNTITLNNPWSGPTFVAGTYVNQSQSGSTYHYSILRGGTLPTAWNIYEASITGISTNNIPDSTAFRPGTEYSKIYLGVNNNKSASYTFYAKNFVYKVV